MLYESSYYLIATCMSRICTNVDSMPIPMTPSPIYHVNISDFSQVQKGELPPFLAAMRIVKMEYAKAKPEVYKMIVAILHDYNNNLGDLHKQKVLICLVLTIFMAMY